MRLAILSNLKHSGQLFLAGVEAELELAEHELAALVKAGVIAVLGEPAAPEAPAAPTTDNDPGDEQPPAPINPAPTEGEGSVASSVEGSSSSTEPGTSGPAAAETTNASPLTGAAIAESIADVAAKPKAKAAK